MKKNFLTVVLFLTSLVTFSQSSSEILVLSATVKDKTIPNAEVIFQKNGETSVTKSTNENGKVVIPEAYRNDEDVVVIIKKEGYSTLITKCPCAGLTYAISPTLKNLDGIRFVLSWGSSPLDLDSHLSYPRGYVCYYDKNARHANLDVDDTDSYGPETITIHRKEQGNKYVYAVHNFSDRGSVNNPNLSAISNAKVFIYIGNTLVKTYMVPPGKKGNVWIPFLIDEMGNIVDVGDFQNAGSWEVVRNILRNYRFDGHSSQVSSYNKSESIRINKQGEKAYHAGHYDEAISLYLDAIDLYPNNGQAYSNLGLAFQKMDKDAEALWANRKAIDLAEGSNAHIVRASSYYNIARIYENRSQWNDALYNFKKAKQNREHRAYDEGIARMLEKL